MLANHSNKSENAMSKDLHLEEIRYCHHVCVGCSLLDNASVDVCIVSVCDNMLYHIVSCIICQLDAVSWTVYYMITGICIICQLDAVSS